MSVSKQNGCFLPEEFEKADNLEGEFRHPISSNLSVTKNQQLPGDPSLLSRNSNLWRQQSEQVDENPQEEVKNLGEKYNAAAKFKFGGVIRSAPPFDLDNH